MSNSPILPTMLMPDESTVTMPMPGDEKSGTPCVGACAPNQSLIPNEVCVGADLVDIQPLNATGGFSNLFRAHKVGLDVDVVIKRVKKVYQGRMNEQSEAKIMTALRHQYLPRVYDLKIASDGFTYTIMELIEGCTLRDYVRQRGSLDQKQVLKWTRQLCEVVDYMHTRKPKGIIHSDLKPENVMITPQGDICVIDFNASLEVKEEGEELEAIGATAGFAAPEQYNVPLNRFAPGHPMRPIAEAAQSMGRVSYRTDIYAIGALAYYMITGYAPKVWVETVIPLEKYDIILGDAFMRVIEKAMEPKPADRYKSAGAMLQSLNSLGKIDKRYRRWLMQSRVAALVIGLGLSASVVCMVLGFHQLRQDRQNEYLQIVEQAQQARSTGRYEDCRELLIQAVNLDGSRIEAYLELGALLYQQGYYSETIALMEDVEFKQASSMDEAQFEDGQGQICYILGSCYYQLEDYSNALANFQLATQFCPTEAAYFRDLAVCYAKTGNQSLAEQALTSMQNLECQSADVSLVQGEIHYAYGQYELAYESLRAAAEDTTDPTLMSRCYTMAAQCCQQLGSGWIDREVELLELASSRLGAGNSLVLQMLSESYLRKSAQPDADAAAYYEKALTCLQQLTDRGYKTFTISQNMAVTLQYLDRFEEAEQILAQMIQDYPSDYRVPMRLALLCADREGEKAASGRDYTAFGTYLEQARKLYQNAGIQDGEMLQLEDLAQQLTAAGWTY